MPLSTDAKTIRQLLVRDAARPPVPLNVRQLPLLDFIAAVSPHFQPPRHLVPMIECLEATESTSVRLIANAPPRHGKTEALLHFVAWTLARHPRKTIGYASHSASLALSKSRLAREYARGAGAQIKDDTDAVHEWRTVQGGGCLAAGVFGSWVGHGVDILLVDDPYADRSEADSPLIRSRVRDWYQSVASTRVEPGGSIVVNHTRWHEKDLAGWLLNESEERGEYVHVNLPAIDGEGTALWPQRWSAEELEKKRRAVGPFEWSSLYLGTPVARGGEVFRGAPTRYTVVDLNGARLVIGCDPAGTTAETSDFTAVVVLACRGYGPDLVADVIECDRFRLEPAASAARLAALKKRYPGASVFIESSRDGKQIVRTLQTIDVSLHFKEVPPHASKLMRAGPCAGAWSEGRLRLPMNAPWLDDYLYEIQRFVGAGDARDDWVDATSLAWNCAATADDWVHKFTLAMASV